MPSGDLMGLLTLSFRVIQIILNSFMRWSYLIGWERLFEAVELDILLKSWLLYFIIY